MPWLAIRVTRQAISSNLLGSIQEAIQQQITQVELQKSQKINLIKEKTCKYIPTKK
jgi:predicted GIY-YIG superfamily endonuclease